MTTLLTCIGMGKLHTDCISIDVQHCPHWLVCGHAAEEEPFLLAIHAVVDVAGTVHAEVQQNIASRVALAQGLGPVAGLVGEVRAGIARQIWTTQCRWVHTGEAEPKNAAPARVGLHKLHIHLEPSRHGVDMGKYEIGQNHVHVNFLSSSISHSL